MIDIDKTKNRSRIDQSAVVPFRLKNDTVEILLITSLQRKKWIIPKGIIDEPMTAREAAGQEAREEAGIKGDVLDIVLGEYSYRKWGGICHVTVFPMHVKKIYNAWPEENLRQRRWFDFEEALKLLEKTELKKLLKNFDKKKKAILSLIF